MSNTVSRPQRDGHPVIPEICPEMLRMQLRKEEKRDFEAEIGGCLKRARHWLGWSLKELAAELGRDERQVARWESGQERTQVGVVWSVQALRQPFVVQLAKLNGTPVRTVIEFDDERIA